MRSPALLLLPLLLASCGEQKPKPYSGQSAHWDQNAVPISLQCAACHAKEFEDWAGSDHAWAWRPVKAELDGEPFHGQSLNAHSSQLQFRTLRGGSLQLQDGQSGRRFTVHSVLGHTPLLQYLVQGEDGGLHTPSAAWDVQKHEWFDVFAQDDRLNSEGSGTREAGEWGHWLGRGMNWNSQCAWCHMSHFRKNYDPETDRFNSRWAEPGVSCIQCHKLAEKPAEDGCMVAKRDRKLSPKQMHDNCASCHARREEMDDNFAAGDSFDEHFHLELPIVEGIFWPNGMQRDEDYCETGLRLSRMGMAGVGCIDCHDPHSAKLKLPQEDNSLCLRCHKDGLKVGTTASPVIDPATHTPCAGAGEKAPRCVDCHMPESPYMARDPRRDHSFNSPDALLSAELGLPNACLNCHKDKDNAWAQAAIEKAYPEQKNARYRDRSRAVAAAQRGEGRVKDLAAAYRREELPAWKATLLELMARCPADAEALQLAREAAQAPDALQRAAAARVLGREALSMVQDRSKLVRRAAAWPLVDSLVQQKIAPETLQELRATARHQSDQPTGAMQEAVLAEAEGKDAEAEKQYLRAISMDPASPVARMDFAVFLARRHRPVEALKQMLDCSARHPQNPTVQYRLGLILAELGQNEAALAALSRAVQLDPNDLNARQNRALLLQAMGRQTEAEAEMNACRALQTPLP